MTWTVSCDKCRRVHKYDGEPPRMSVRPFYICRDCGGPMRVKKEVNMALPRPKIPRPISDEEYLDGERLPNLCPFCRSFEVDGEGVDIQGRRAVQQVMCLECEAVWLDIYDLAGYDVVSGPSEP